MLSPRETSVSPRFMLQITLKKRFSHFLSFSNSLCICCENMTTWPSHGMPSSSMSTWGWGKGAKFNFKNVNYDDFDEDLDGDQEKDLDHGKDTRSPPQNMRNNTPSVAEWEWNEDNLENGHKKTGPISDSPSARERIRWRWWWSWGWFWGWSFSCDGGHQIPPTEYEE